MIFRIIDKLFPEPAPGGGSDWGIIRAPIVLLFLFAVFIGIWELLDLVSRGDRG